MPIIDRTVVSTGTLTDPYDLGNGMTYSVTAGNQDGGAVYVESTGVASGTDLMFSWNGVTTEEGKGGAIYNAGWLLLYGGTTFSSNSVYDGASGAVYNAGTGKFFVSDTVTLSTDTDTVYNEGVMLWNLVNGVNYQSKVVNYEYVTNATEENPVTGEMNPVGKMAIVVSGEYQENGTYVLATGNLSGAEDDDTGKYEFYLTDDGETFSGNLDLCGTVWFSDHTYTLTIVNDNTLRLVVADGDHPHMTVSSATCPESEGLFTITLNIDGESVTTYAGDGGVFTVESTGTLKNESGITIKKVKAAGNGGAISSVGKLDLNDITFEENYSSSANGGAISITGGTENTIKNATFKGNAIGDVSTSTGGGAIYMENATLALENVLFTTNSSSEFGGAIYAKNSTLNISGDTAFNSNVAWQGGAINADTTTLNLTNVSFKENTAENGGGAIMASKTSVVTLDGVTFDSNNGGTIGGGAICLYDSAQIKLTGSVTLKNDSDTILFTCPSQNMTWVISDTDSKIGYLSDYSLIGHNSAITSFTKENFTIDAEDALQSEYTLAGSASNADGQEFTIITADGTSQTITVNGDVVTDATYGIKYTLAVNTDYDLVLSVEKANVTLAVFNQERTYDGTTALVDTEGYMFTGLAAGFTGSATLTNDKSDAGTYTEAIDATDITIKNGQDDVTKYYNVTTNKGNLTINKREVTITSASDSKMYDGTALTNDAVTVSGDGFVGTEGATYDVTGSQTKVGSSANAFTYTLNDGTKAGNYEITMVEGTLEVTVNDQLVNLWANSASKMYDGAELTDFGYTWDGLATGDAFTEVGLKGGQTHAGLSANGITSYKVINEAGEDVTFCYSNIRTHDGVLEVTKRDVTIESGSANKYYDGTALTNDTITVSGSGWVDGEGATYDVTGSQTSVGVSANTFTYELNDGTLASDYAITQKEGVLAVFPTIKQITITANSASKTYDGTALTASGYTVTGELFDGDTLVDVVVEGTITDAGKAASEVVSYRIVNNEGKDVTSNYVKVWTVDGTLEITQRDVTLTSASDSKLYDGTPLTNSTVTVSGDGFIDGEGATYDVTGAQTEIGSSDNTFTYTANNGTNAANYNITTVYGTLNVPAMSKDTYDKQIINAEFVYSEDKGALSVVASAGNDLTTEDIDLLMLKKGVNSVEFIEQDLIGINKLMLKEAGVNKTIAFSDAYGTTKSDKITFGKNSDIVFGSADHKIDLEEGNNTIQIDRNAQTVIQSNLTNVSTVKAASGSTVSTGDIDFQDGRSASLKAEGISFAAGKVSGASDKATTIATGTKTAFESGTIELGIKGDKISTGKESAFTAEDILFGEGSDKISTGKSSVFEAGNISSADTINLGAYSTMQVGNITETKKLTISNGKEGQVATLNASAVTGTAKNDTFSLGNWNDVNFASLDLDDGNDSLTIGNYADVDITSLVFGDGKDTLTLGKETTATIDTLTFGDGKDTLTIGRDATLIVDTLDVDDLEKLTMYKGATLVITDSECLEAAQNNEKWQKYVEKGQITGI